MDNTTFYRQSQRAYRAGRSFHNQVYKPLRKQYPQQFAQAKKLAYVSVEKHSRNPRVKKAFRKAKFVLRRGARGVSKLPKMAARAVKHAAETHAFIESLPPALAATTAAQYIKRGASELITFGNEAMPFLETAAEGVMEVAPFLI